MSEIKLKPCPFCGGEARYFPFWNENPADYWVRCKICGCETACYDTQEDAAVAWNRRAGNETDRCG